MPLHPQSSPKATPAKPFLKWVGGKRQLLPELLGLLPERWSAYHEPFLGGGALFFALHRAGRLNGIPVVLSDVNAELITTYSAVREQVEQVIALLSSYPHEAQFYYELRTMRPEQLSPVEAAARMMYLNRTGFNGLYRVNSRGEFNVPFGSYKNPRLVDADNLRAVSLALREVQLRQSDFEQVLCAAMPGALVYLDPPYVPVSTTASFTDYASGGFGLEQQERLAAAFAAAAARGVWVVLSNSDVPWIRERYGEFRVVPVQARRALNSDTSKRGQVGEVIVCGW